MGVACEHRARLVSPIIRRLWRLYMGTQGAPKMPRSAMAKALPRGGTWRGRQGVAWACGVRGSDEGLARRLGTRTRGVAL